MAEVRASAREGEMGGRAVDLCRVSPCVLFVNFFQINTQNGAICTKRNKMITDMPWICHAGSRISMGMTYVTLILVTDLFLGWSYPYMYRAQTLKS